MSETTATPESPITYNEAPPPSVNPDIDNLFKDTPLLDPENAESDPENNFNLKMGNNVLKSLVITLQKLSRFASRKTGLEAVELTDEDVEELTDALEPFAKEILKYIEFLPYLPLIMFAVAYGIRILAEIDEKKKAGKDAAAARVAAAKARLVEQQQQKKKEPEDKHDEDKTAG